MRWLTCSLCCSLWMGLAQAESPRAAMAFAAASPPVSEINTATAAISVQASTPSVSTSSTSKPSTSTPAASILEPVIIYTSVGCGYCRRLKARLTAAHVPYLEYDIAQTPEGRMYAQSPTYAGVPLTVLGDLEVIGDDLDALRELFQRAGYPPHML
jgi:glutaredoxin